jgi:hypothetical protein
MGVYLEWDFTGYHALQVITPFFPVPIHLSGRTRCIILQAVGVHRFGPTVINSPHNFTFFEPCIALHLCNGNQQNAHFLIGTWFGVSCFGLHVFIPYRCIIFVKVFFYVLILLYWVFLLGISNFTFLNRALWYTYVIRTNKMQTFLLLIIT